MKPLIHSHLMGGNMRSVYIEMFQLALYTVVSRNEYLFSEISAVNLTVA